MKINLTNAQWTLIFGGCTFVLLSSRPYLLDFIEPAKSVRRLIGENARELLDSLEGKPSSTSSISKRELWSNIILIIAFMAFSLTVLGLFQSFQKGEKKWLAVGGSLLAALGILVYFTHVVLSVFLFIMVGILALFLVFFLKSS